MTQQVHVRHCSELANIVLRRLHFITSSIAVNFTTTCGSWGLSPPKPR